MSPDEALLLWINQTWANPVLDWVLPWVSERGAFSIPLLLVLLLDAGRRDGWRGARWWLALVVTVGVGDFFGNQLKDVFAEARPCYAIHELARTVGGGRCGNALTGMPSNHALNFFAAAVFVRLTVPWHSWRIVTLTSAVLAALSRVYLAKHYPSQVVFGAALGMIVGLLGACAYRLPSFLNRPLHAPQVPFRPNPSEPP